MWQVRGSQAILSGLQFGDESDSELEGLAVLKDIKELDVRLANHKIGARELEWMIEH